MGWGEQNKCKDCNHPITSHKYEPGFYDVVGHRAECTYVGCNCKKARY